MSGRDEKGQFAAGNKASAGHGRPPGAKTSDLLQRMRDGISGEDWDKIWKRAVKDAAAGNTDARRWVSEYVVGKPPNILELRASEAAMLRELLQRFVAEGVPASDVFHAMLATFAESEVDE